MWKRYRVEGNKKTMRWEQASHVEWVLGMSPRQGPPRAWKAREEQAGGEGAEAQTMPPEDATLTVGEGRGPPKRTESK